jgi:hypothetical protein
VRVLDEFLEDEGETHFADHVAGEVEVFDSRAGDEVLDCVHAVLGDGVVGEVEFGEAVWGEGYWWVSRVLISFMIVLTPSRMELRLRMYGNFLELTLFRLSLNIFAFSRSGFSPVSWQREKKISDYPISYPRGTPARRST